MSKLLRYGGWALLGVALLWLVLEILSIVFGVISWVVSTVVTLLVVAGLLYLAYRLVSWYFGSDKSPTRSTSRSREKEKEKIFE